MLLSALQKSDSVIHKCTFFFIFFSIKFYLRILNIAHCAILAFFIHLLYKSMHLLTSNFMLVKVDMWSYLPDWTLSSIITLLSSMYKTNSHGAVFGGIATKEREELL